MSSVVISGDTSGSITVAAPTVAGSNTQTLAAVTGTLAPIVSGTAVSPTSGTTLDFNNIPSWVKRITINYDKVVMTSSGGQTFWVQLGTASSIETTNYVSVCTLNVAATLYQNGSSSAFTFYANSGGPFSGCLILSLLNSSTNTWSGCGDLASLTPAVYSLSTAGSKSLSGPLTRIRLTSDTGVNTFVSGQVNILYE